MSSQDQNTEKIQPLLSHQDLTIVQQGFALLETRFSTQEEFFDVMHEMFGLNAAKEPIAEIQRITKEQPNRRLLIKWIWAQLEGFGIEWALNRERRYVVQLKDYTFFSGLPHFHYVEKITKDAYDFWKEKTTKELLEYLKKFGGECAFDEKCLNAQNGGARACVVVNSANAFRVI